jgi:hypothetical protein
MAINKSFDFKNTSEITFPQELIHAQDLYGMIGFARGFGIISGCGITRATNQITIASGTLLIAGSEVSFGGGSQTVDDTGMSSGQHRWTNIYITGAGAIGKTDGTATISTGQPIKTTDTTNYVICSALKLWGSNLTDDRVVPSSLDLANTILPIENLENTSSAYMIVGNVSGVPTWTAITGHINISNSGATTLQALTSSESTVQLDTTSYKNYALISGSGGNMFANVFGIRNLSDTRNLLTIDSTGQHDIYTYTGISQDALTITPQNSLNAGTTWHGLRINGGALDPATGTASAIRGTYVDFGGVFSVDHDAIVVGNWVVPSTNDLTYCFYTAINELGWNTIQSHFVSQAPVVALEGIATYRGLHIDWDALSTPLAAAKLEGIRVELPTDYTSFGISYAGYFRGDGKTVYIADDTYNIKGTVNETGTPIVALFDNEYTGATVGLDLDIMANRFETATNYDMGIKLRASTGNINGILTYHEQVTAAWRHLIYDNQGTVRIFSGNSVEALEFASADQTATFASDIIIPDDKTLGLNGGTSIGIKHRSASSDMVFGTIAGTGLVLTDAGVLTVGSTLYLSSVVNAATDTDKFLVLDSGNRVDFRTGAEVLSDIGGQTQDDILDDIAGLTQAANDIPYFDTATTASVLNFHDEDTMTSNDALGVASQQSIKAYVDGAAIQGQYIVWISLYPPFATNVNSGYAGGAWGGGNPRYIADVTGAMSLYWDLGSFAPYQAAGNTVTLDYVEFWFYDSNLSTHTITVTCYDANRPTHNDTYKYQSAASSQVSQGNSVYSVKVSPSGTGWDPMVTELYYTVQWVGSSGTTGQHRPYAMAIAYTIN